MANACGTTWRLGDRTPTQATEGIVSQQLVAIVSTDGVANAGGTTWVRGSNPRGSTIWGHSSGVEQCFPDSCRHIPHQKMSKLLCPRLRFRQVAIRSGSQFTLSVNSSEARENSIRVNSWQLYLPRIPQRSGATEKRFHRRDAESAEVVPGSARFQRAWGVRPLHAGCVRSQEHVSG